MESLTPEHPRIAYNNQSMSVSETQSFEARRKRASRTLAVVAVLFVVVPFLFWRGTWFGRSLSEDELGQYITDTEHPRHNQHALVQISERIDRGDASVKRWYPQVVNLAASPHPEIRVTLAWVLGADTHSEEFHRTLLNLLQDPEPLVRRNAALSLVRFGDRSGRPELINMLRPYSVHSSAAGTLRYSAKPGDSIESGALLAKLENPGKDAAELRAPVPGKIQTLLAREGDSVSAGQEILVLSPSSEHAWESLRALYFVGAPGDVPEVEQFVKRDASAMDGKIQQQASATLAEILHRSADSSSVH